MNTFFSKLLYCFLIMVGSASLQAQTSIAPVVDLRAETISIIFRLAGADEYNGQYLEPYVKEIETHFRSFQNHPAVTFAKEIRSKRGVGFDAVMSMAVHIGNAPDFKPVVSFTDEVPDKRWGKRGAEKFIVLLKDFYKDANCEMFFEKQKPYFAGAERNFKSSMIRGVDVQWYETYYGEKPSGSFNLIIGLGNGGNNYGSKVKYPDGHEDLYSIISNALPDSAGNATFKPENIQSTIIHEYNHSFINHLVYAQPNLFKPDVKKVFDAVKEKMQAMHYGNWETMVNESLVRAGEIQYDKMHGANENEILKRIRAEQARGFVWMDKLDSLLEVYKADRSKYPTFQSFLPEIASFYKSLAPQANTLLSDFEKQCAHVVSVDPLGSSPVIESSVTELAIHFDKQMAKSISINPGKSGMDHFPTIRSRESITWSEDGKTLRIKVELKPAWEYSFILTSLSFKTTDGYPLRSHTVDFKTK